MHPQLKIKRLSDSAVLPTKAHPTDLGYDLYADEEVQVFPNRTVKIKTGICIGFPENWGGFIEDRSSMAMKGFGVKAGVIDETYSGEISIVLTYTSENNTPYIINKGDKIAQLVPIPRTNWVITEVGNIPATGRGSNGFGSSGKT
jgi:dUTP pyrophosphatase